MPELKPESKPDPKPGGKARAARRSARSGLLQIPGGDDFRTAIDQRDRLYREASQDPDSDAGEMIQMFALTGMLAGKAGVPRALSAEMRRRAELERLVHEQGLQLDEIAEAAEDAKAEEWDAMTIYNRIAQIVGLKVPSPVPQAPEQPRQQPAQPETTEDICQTQIAQTPRL